MVIFNQTRFHFLRLPSNIWQQKSVHIQIISYKIYHFFGQLLVIIYQKGQNCP